MMIPLIHMGRGAMVASSNGHGSLNVSNASEGGGGRPFSFVWHRHLTLATRTSRLARLVMLIALRVGGTESRAPSPELLHWEFMSIVVKGPCTQMLWVLLRIDGPRDAISEEKS
jgi:hypothetical protein